MYAKQKANKNAEYNEETRWGCRPSSKQRPKVAGLDGHYCGSYFVVQFTQLSVLTHGCCWSLGVRPPIICQCVIH